MKLYDGHCLRRHMRWVGILLSLLAIHMVSINTLGSRSKAVFQISGEQIDAQRAADDENQEILIWIVTGIVMAAGVSLFYWGATEGQPLAKEEPVIPSGGTPETEQSLGQGESPSRS